MFDLLLAICFVACSLVGFVNVSAMWRDRQMKGVSIIPTCVFLTTNIIEIPFFLLKTATPYLAVGAALMAVSNLVWLIMALCFRAHERQTN